MSRKAIATKNITEIPALQNVVCGVLKRLIQTMNFASLVCKVESNVKSE